MRKRDKLAILDKLIEEREKREKDTVWLLAMAGLCIFLALLFHYGKQ